MTQKTERKSEMIYANVVEPAFGLDRILYCLLESSWKSDGEREWISLPQDTSPYDLLVAPLMTKDGLDDSAKEIFSKAQEIGIDAYYDEAGSIGRRYGRRPHGSPRLSGRIGWCYARTTGRGGPF